MIEVSAGDGEVGGIVARLTSLIERQRELAQIQDVLADAVAGRGRVCAIDAPGGAGKSALLREARAGAVEAGMLVLDASGSELEVEYPFGAVLNLFESWLADAGEQGKKQLFMGQARLAGALLTGDDTPGVTTDGDEFTLIYGLYWCIVNLCETAPVVILMDDVHLADDPSLRFLNYLAARLDDLPVALLVAVRSGDVRAGAQLVTHLCRQEHVTSIRPGALTQDAVAALLRRAQPHLSLPPEAVRRVG